ncbi:hypothetical protein PCANC_12112 [Puccinia coronata f. sp. avenae]|uniref:Deoxycytidylate deaminase n=1 Tax=Puccinia coronata f. sp. avenae TaxID=200324 RepID=A0A2N5UWT2_9BASI|nr:hypothetical protein PCANC_26353 [Puccinia coronata f. sp. avenae]PLW42220.1 hypothetical protein PCANC_12112 [Puccinia coronata f. sp. avenae]
MLIALFGGRGTGKSTIVDELVRRHGFRILTLGPDRETPFPSGTPSPSGTATSSSDDSPVLRFASAHDLLTFATANWTHPFVTTHLRSPRLVLPFIKRPFFVLVYVQARILDRWNRILATSTNSSALNLEEFLRQDDVEQFGKPATGVPEEERAHAKSRILHQDSTKENVALPITQKLERMNMREEEEDDTSSMRAMMSLVSYTITNDQPLPAFLASINTTHLPNMRKSIRPSWDTYFIELANLASLRSNCMKRRVGAVLVTVDKRVVSTGYNGTPRGMTNCNEGGCSRCNGKTYSAQKLTEAAVSSCGENLEECLCLHAEENALLEAGRDRISSASLYCNTCPCLRCSIKIVQCGIKEVIYSQSYSMDEQTEQIFRQAGIKLRQFT